MNKHHLTIRRLLAFVLALTLTCSLTLGMSASAAQGNVQNLLDGMSLDDKLSQMIIPAFRTRKATGAAKGAGVTDLDQAPELAQALKKHNYGGVILFGSNVKGTEQTAKLLHQLQANNAGSVPYLTAVDQEGGIVCRLSTGTRMSGNMALGATGEQAEANAGATGELIGSELAALGFLVDFAPSVDVNSNPANPVIGTRSFSDDPALVAKLGVAYAQGLNAQGVIACMKHFPGHGDTGTDSHLGTSTVQKDLEALEQCELVPFKAAIAKGADLIMTAHITLPLYDEEQTFADGSKGYYPATMSHKVITELLRGELGYQGVVVTDALEMNALYDHALVPGEKTSAEYAANLAEKAINAGVDILLLPRDMTNPQAVDFYDSYISELESKVQGGTISIDRVNESVTRILKLKEKYGILNRQNGDLNTITANAKQVVGSADHHQTEADLAQQAMTLLKNDENLLPYAAEGKKIVLLTRKTSEEAILWHTLTQLRTEGVLPKDARLVNAVTGDSVGEESSQTLVTLDSYIANSQAHESEAVQDADLVAAVSMTGGMGTLSENSMYHQGLSKAMEAVHSHGGKFLLLSANLPYDAARYQDSDAILLAYLSSGMGLTPEPQTDGSVANYNANLIAALRTVFGAAEPTGSLPVQIPVLKRNDDGTVSVDSQVLYQRGTSLRYPAPENPENPEEPVEPVAPKQQSIKKADIGKVGNQVWNGKAKKPAVKVTLSGKTLKAKRDYTVTYKSNVNPGTASIIVQGKGDYTGKRTVRFNILPKGTKVTKVKGIKKGLTVRWNAQTDQNSGYQIQVSQKKSFEDKKTVTVSGKKKKKVTIRKLKSGKQYYIRIRTFKTVNKKNYYSGWSGVKKAKTK